MTTLPLNGVRLRVRLVEGRFTQPYADGQRIYTVKPAQVPSVFREVRQAGEEALSFFLEEGGSLAKASCFPAERLQRFAARATAGAAANAKVSRPAQWHEDDQTE